MRWFPTRKREVPSEPTDPSDPLSIWEWLFTEGGGSPVTAMPFSPRLLDRVWVANRCLQLCSQQVGSMPLRFFGGTSEPAWVANPDPVWFPNGIGDAVFSATWSQLGWGDAFLLITARYANGFPSAWTVLDPGRITVQLEKGRRTYRSATEVLNSDDVIQISRDSRGGLRGTSALAAYSAQCWGTLAASELGRTMVGAGGAMPNAVLKSKHKLNAGQAQALQNQWMAARQRSGVGAPAILPPEIDFQQLAFSPSDLMLLDVQRYDANAIASAFSVPSFLLNLPLEGTGSRLYQNPETLYEVWWRNELRHIAGRIQRALSANMLPRGQWVEFDARAVLAPTFSEQVTSWLALLTGGVVTVDEVRAAILHLPPLAQGEALQDLTEPPTAAASPTQQQPPSDNVQELRPTAWVTGVTG